MTNNKSELLEEIYERAVEGSDHMNEVENAVAQKLDALLESYHLQHLEPDKEEDRNVLYEMINIAEKEAFVSGMRYGIKLAAESFLTECRE